MICPHYVDPKVTLIRPLKKGRAQKKKTDSIPSPVIDYVLNNPEMISTKRPILQRVNSSSTCISGILPNVIYILMHHTTDITDDNTGSIGP